MIDFLTSLQFQRKIHLIYYVPIQESLVAQKGRASQVLPLGQEDPLEKEMAIHSGTLAWKIPWTEEPGSHSPWGHKELGTTERLLSFSYKMVFSVSCTVVSYALRSHGL